MMEILRVGLALPPRHDGHAEDVVHVVQRVAHEQVLLPGHFPRTHRLQTRQHLTARFVTTPILIKNPPTTSLGRW